MFGGKKTKVTYMLDIVGQYFHDFQTYQDSMEVWLKSQRCYVSVPMMLAHSLKVTGPGLGMFTNIDHLIIMNVFDIFCKYISCKHFHSHGEMIPPIEIFEFR